VGHVAAQALPATWPPSAFLPRGSRASRQPISSCTAGDAALLLGTAISVWRIRRPAYLFVLTYWGGDAAAQRAQPGLYPAPAASGGRGPAAYTLAAIGALGWWNWEGGLHAADGDADGGQLTAGGWLAAVVLMILG